MYQTEKPSTTETTICILTEISLTELLETKKWHNLSLSDKVQTFTTVQQEAFLGIISFKQKSLRGNTKPRYIVDLIKSKRRIQNKLRTLDTNTRIREENMLNLCLQRPPVNQIPSMNDREYIYWLMIENHYKTEVRSLRK